MAFVQNDEEDQQNNNVSPNGGGAVHLAPSSGVGSTAPGAPSGGSASKAAGGQFATLNDYVTANQGQAAPLANKITGQIGQQYSGLDQANQGVLQNIQGQVTNAPGYAASDNDLIAKESANPTSFASDPNNIASFQKQLTSNYSGPNSAESDSGYQSQQSAINNAISQGNAQTTTEAGRQQLIAQNSAKPTQGVTALNSAILSQDPTYLGKVQDAYKPFQNLVTGLSSGAQDINKNIASEKADATKASSTALNAITGQETGLNTAINNQVAQQQQQATAQNASAKNALTTGNVTPQDLQTLGMTQDQWNTLSGAQKAAATSQLVSSNQNQFQANSGTANIDLTNWLQQQDPNTAFNAGNVATADQYKQAQAFQSLLNGLNLQTPTLAINPGDAAKAGTAPTNLNTFGYQNALQNTQDTSAAEKSAAQAYVDALQSGADEEHAQLAAQNAQKNASMAGIAGLASTPIGATEAAVSGLAGAGQNVANQAKNTISSPKNAALNIAENVATGGLSSLGQAGASGVKQAVKTVSNIFCFHPDTQIEMANGSTKAICKIRIGDETKGGLVIATTRGLGQGFYWYKGVLVTAKHAVKEDGVWVRVEDSKQGRKFPYLTEVVCNLVTEHHRIWAHGIEFADEYENDNYENLSLRESLDQLNQGGVA